MRTSCLIALIGFLAPALAPAAPDAPNDRAPIIDLHVHAAAADDNGPPPLAICAPLVPEMMPHFDSRRPWGEVLGEASSNPRCERPHWSPTSDETLMREVVEALEQRNARAVLSGPPARVRSWMKAAPGRFLGGLQLQLGRDPYGPDEVRELLASGDFVILGEISNQYVGIAPDDPRMAPYYAVAAELDIPVAIHMGYGPPGAGQLFEGMRVAHSDPLLLEPVLKRHPNLRVAVMHAGEPFIDSMLGILYSYPQVYVDLGGMTWMKREAHIHDQLKRFVDAGFAHRVMFGSDTMVWSSLIGPAIDVIEDAPFLSPEQKRMILHDNAARFLDLDGARDGAGH